MSPLHVILCTLTIAACFAVAAVFTKAPWAKVGGAVAMGIAIGVLITAVIKVRR